MPVCQESGQIVKVIVKFVRMEIVLKIVIILVISYLVRLKVGKPAFVGVETRRF